MTKKPKTNPILSSGFLLRHNDKKYYTTVGITLGVIALIIIIIGLFTPNTATVKLPFEPERALWPAVVDQNGSTTSRKIFVNETDGKNTSLMLFDPWSFTHVTHGVLFFCILFILNIIAKKFFNFHISLLTMFMITLTIELLWEYIENSTHVINKYRSYSQYKNYSGDSIVNSLGDIFCCLLGFLLASISPATAITYTAVSETLLWPDGFIVAFIDIFK